MSKRRDFLKASGLTIPTVWTVPLVESVLLPAHAQTTGEEEPVSEPPTTQPVCSTILTGSDYTISCSDAESYRQWFYRIDDTPGAPPMVCVEENIPPLRTTPAGVFQVEVLRVTDPNNWATINAQTAATSPG